jgi:hypothetical protein
MLLEQAIVILLVTVPQEHSKGQRIENPVTESLPVLWNSVTLRLHKTSLFNTGSITHGRVAFGVPTAATYTALLSM